MAQRNPNLLHDPKLTWHKVDEIRRVYKWHSSTQGCAALAKRFGVSANAIHKIVTGKTWKLELGSDRVPPPLENRFSFKDILKHWRRMELLRAKLDRLSKSANSTRRSPD